MMIQRMCCAYYDNPLMCSVDLMSPHLKSTGAALGALHPHPTCTDMPCGHRHGCTCVCNNLFIYLFIFLIRAETCRTGQNSCFKKDRVNKFGKKVSHQIKQEADEDRN